MGRRPGSSQWQRQVNRRAIQVNRGVIQVNQEQVQVQVSVNEGQSPVSLALSLGNDAVNSPSLESIISTPQSLISSSTPSSTIPSGTPMFAHVINMPDQRSRMTYLGSATSSMESLSDALDQERNINYDEIEAEQRLNSSENLLTKDCIADNNTSTGKSGEKIRINARRHIIRCFVPIGLLLLFTMIMTMIQVYSDQNSMVYFYGIHTKGQWDDMVSWMTLIQKNSTLRTAFPSILVSQNYGGYGQSGQVQLNTFLSEIQTKGNIEKSDEAMVSLNRQVLKINDFVLKRLDGLVENVKAIADLLVTFIFLMTILFLLLLPYVEAFKTRITRTLKSTPALVGSAGPAVSLSSDSLPARDRSSIPVCAGNASVPNLAPVLYHRGQSLFLFKHRWIHGLVFLRRLIMIVALNYLLRAFLVWMTIFPQESYECIPIWTDNIGQVICQAFQMVIGTRRACFDFMFSGHTSLTVICSWFWFVYSASVLLHPRRYYMDISEESIIKEEARGSINGSLNETPNANSSETLNGNSFDTLNATPSRLRKRHFAAYQKPRQKTTLSLILVWLIRAIFLALLSLVAIFMTISKIHYTVDIGVGLIIGTLLFWFYHALLSLFYYFHFRRDLLEEDSDNDQGFSSEESQHASSSKEESSRKKKREFKRQSNREIRDILVPLKSMNFFLSFIGYIDGYDLYQKDNIGYTGNLL